MFINYKGLVFYFFDRAYSMPTKEFILFGITVYQSLQCFLQQNLSCLIKKLRIFQQICLKSQCYIYPGISG